MEKYIFEYDIEDGAQTRYMEKRFRESQILVLNESNIEDIIYDNEWNETNYFLEGVVKRLNKLGVICDIEDTELILTEVRNRFKERIGLPLYQKHKAIEKWITGKAIPSSKNRRTNYEFCYALEMNLQETAEFFSKYFLTIPFNYKDCIDAIFFYGLKAQRPYSVIEKMLDDSREFSKNKASYTDTMEIGKHILEIDNDEDFTNYLVTHCYDETQQYQETRKRIVKIIDKYTKYNSIADFYTQITRINYQETVSYSKLKRTQELPKEFMVSYPTDRTFLDIQKGKKESYETLRKTLIVLLFYDYYKQAEEKVIRPSDKQIREWYADFCSEVNDNLFECGLAPIYARHPFDGLILSCALTKSPLDAFICLNQMRYPEV